MSKFLTLDIDRRLFLMYQRVMQATCSVYLTRALICHRQSQVNMAFRLRLSVVPLTSRTALDICLSPNHVGFVMLTRDGALKSYSMQRVIKIDNEDGNCYIP